MENIRTYEGNNKPELRIWVRTFRLDLSDSIESTVGFQKRREFPHLHNNYELLKEDTLQVCSEEFA